MPDTPSPIDQLSRLLDDTEQLVATVRDDQWGIRIVEQLVHGWDLATATGQRPAFADEIAEQALAFTRPNLANIPPDRQPFGPPRAVSDSAPALDRLAALCGRKVA